jgi:hypothetical protein
MKKIVQEFEIWSLKNHLILLKVLMKFSTNFKSFCMDESEEKEMETKETKVFYAHKALFRTNRPN